ncbi:MAG: hypothetical protein QOH48_2116 [Actinomycetota bacterium]|jgi:hypothetical protein|nr:hypothetical protein [Actinomycetota bacterium]
MKRRLLLGGGAALLYLVGAVVTQHLDPFGTRPVLDGLAPPPAYRWVQPPADLAAGNKKPYGGTFSLKFTGGRSEAGAFTTRDSQLSMILDPGTLPPSAKPTSASISISPMSAASTSQPHGFQIDGNVYRITVKEEPGNSQVKRFAHPQRVILVYPADKSFVKPQHILVASKDGKTWISIKTQDSTVQQQASGLIPAPELVAVVVPIKSAGSTNHVLLYVIAAIVILAIAGFLGWWMRRRSNHSTSPKRRRG